MTESRKDDASEEHKIHIIIADDNKESAQNLSTAIQAHVNTLYGEEKGQRHFSIEVYHDGLAAFNRISTLSPKAVSRSIAFLDKEMPEMTGDTLLTLWSQSHIPEIKNFPVFLMTGDSNELSSKINDRDNFHYVMKPYRYIHLLNMLTGHLNEMYEPLQDDICKAAVAETLGDEVSQARRKEEATHFRNIQNLRFGGQAAMREHLGIDYIEDDSSNMKYLQFLEEQKRKQTQSPYTGI